MLGSQDAVNRRARRVGELVERRLHSSLVRSNLDSSVLHAISVTRTICEKMELAVVLRDATQTMVQLGQWTSTQCVILAIAFRSMAIASWHELDASAEQRANMIVSLVQDAEQDYQRSADTDEFRAELIRVMQTETIGTDPTGDVRDALLWLVQFYGTGFITQIRLVEGSPSNDELDSLVNSAREAAAACALGQSVEERQELLGSVIAALWDWLLDLGCPYKEYDSVSTLVRDAAKLLIGFTEP